MSRCLYDSDLQAFTMATQDSILGIFNRKRHGMALTTTEEEWESEIAIMNEVLSSLEAKDGRIVFEYDIPRLGKRIDVVLLLNGIIFCLEFKVGESKILEADVDRIARDHRFLFLQSFTFDPDRQDHR